MSVEWIVTSAATVDEAKSQALDELGIDESEAEFDVIETPVQGLFGRMRGEARVRARVTPKSPRPKLERRGGRSTRSSGKGRKKAATRAQPAKKSPAASRPPKKSGRAAATDDTSSTGQAEPAQPPAKRVRSTSRSRTRTTDQPASAPPSPDPSTVEAPASRTENEAPVSDITLSEQADATADFLRGLLDAFDFDGEVEIRTIDDENAEVVVDGSDLGLLIGPRGQTLQAIGELSRAASAQTLSGRAAGRVHLDIAQYRQKRREALSEFTRKIAADVLDSGTAKALEPMGAADRKVVHDTCNEIDGVSTISEGEDPRRRVVIEPA